VEPGLLFELVAVHQFLFHLFKFQSQVFLFEFLFFFLLFNLLLPLQQLIFRLEVLSDDILLLLLQFLFFFGQTMRNVSGLSSDLFLNYLNTFHRQFSFKHFFQFIDLKLILSDHCIFGVFVDFGFILDFLGF
jgi:hypothetical protein